MKHKLFTILLALMISVAATAQDEVYSSSGRPLNKSEKNVKSDKLIDPDRFIYGGWGVFGIGAGVTNVGVTPIFGYRITDGFSAGIGFGYQYLRIKDYFQIQLNMQGDQGFKNLDVHSYSPSVWARHIIWNNIFAHVEYEHNISSYKEYFSNTLVDPPYQTRNVNLSVPCLLVGAGLRQPIGERSSVIFMLMYDVLQHEYSPYRNTIAIRIGINAGF